VRCRGRVHSGGASLASGVKVCCGVKGGLGGATLPSLLVPWLSRAAAAAGMGLNVMTGGDSRLLARGSRSSRSVLEQRTEGGESPVGDRATAGCVMNVSTAGHAESGGKQGRPRPKAKIDRSGRTASFDKNWVHRTRSIQWFK
jgi:hypothetical protein